MLSDPRIKKFEPLLFLSLLLAYLLPLLCFRLFPTLDGPAHLYNANIIGRLIGGDAHFGAFFGLSTYPEPNLLGHFLMTLLNTFLPAWMAEKFVLVLYAAGLALSFRTLVHTIRPDALFTDYFIFPFIYTFPFCIGFFNFCLSIPLCFFSLALWLRFRERRGLKRGLGLAALLLLTYFAHASSFFIALLIVFAVLAYELLRNTLRQTGSFRNFIRECLLFGLACLPALLFTISFLLRHSGETREAYHVPAETIIDWLTRIGPIVTRFEPTENPLGYALAAVIALLLIAAIVFALRKKETVSPKGGWLLALLLAALLLFILPDQMASGGYVSIRLTLYVFLLLLLWIAVQPLPRAVAMIGAVLVLGVNHLHLHYHFDTARRMSGEAENFYDAAAQIPDGATVLPLNYSDDWQHGNYATYMGSDKPVIVLDNYEAAAPHFFTRWKEKMFPYQNIGDYGDSRRPCVKIDAYEKRTGRGIDFVSLWRWNETMNDSCTQDVLQQLDSLYKPVFISEDRMLRLYRRAQ